jgi:hypothetical protein
MDLHTLVVVGEREISLAYKELLPQAYPQRIHRRSPPPHLPQGMCSWRQFRRTGRRERITEALPKAGPMNG